MRTPEARKAYNRQYWRAHWHYQGSVPDDNLPPGQYVACCGRWVSLDAIPLTCPLCQRVFFAEREESSNGL